MYICFSSGDKPDMVKPINKDYYYYYKRPINSLELC